MAQISKKGQRTSASGRSGGRPAGSTNRTKPKTAGGSGNRMKPKTAGGGSGVKPKTAGGSGNRMKNERTGGKSRGLLIFVLCLMLITLAVFGGYALAGYIRNGGAGQKTPSGHSENVNNKTDETGVGVTGAPGVTGGADADGTADPSGKTQESGNDAGYDNTVLLKTTSEIIYAVDPETHRIDQILLGILGSGKGKLDYIRIDTDVSYTMSAGLYTLLTPDNTTLPQTVTFSELLKYYNSDRAFDAGRRILSEMLSCNIVYYTAMTGENFNKVFSIREYSDETVMGFAEDEASMKSGYGTEGSLKGFLEERFRDCVTNWSTDQRLRYLDTWDLLDKRDVTFADAPVEERNESSRLDTDAVAGLLYDILY